MNRNEQAKTLKRRLLRAVAAIGADNDRHAKRDESGSEAALHEQTQPPARYNPHRGDCRPPYVIYLHNCRALGWSPLSYGDWLAQAKQTGQGYKPQTQTQ